MLYLIKTNGPIDLETVTKTIARTTKEFESEETEELEFTIDQPPKKVTYKSDHCRSIGQLKYMSSVYKLPVGASSVLVYGPKDHKKSFSKIPESARSILMDIYFIPDMIILTQDSLARDHSKFGHFYENPNASRRLYLGVLGTRLKNISGVKELAMYTRTATSKRIEQRTEIL